MNNNCDGSGPHTLGEVRALPFPGGNLILCRSCFRRELTWRAERNHSLSKEAQYSLPLWDDLKVYGEV